MTERSNGAAPPSARYEILIDTGGSRGPELAAQHDLDRLPDREGRVRALVTEDDLARLQASGAPIEVGARLDVAPLDPALVASDDEAQRWLEERLHGIRREKGDQ